nr:competence type IV pilus assembly protein ComGB [Enterococcus sp. 4G2_DIV0659]
MKKKKNNRLTKKQQRVFIHLLTDLLRNGFTIQESLSFMKKSNSIPSQPVDYVLDCMEQGESLNTSLAVIGFKEIIVTQIEFAQIHGDLAGTLKKIKDYLELMDRQQQNIYKVVSYPLLLMLFLTVVLISIRQVLLPQLMKNGTIHRDNIGITFIQHSPYYILSVLSLVCISTVIIRLYLKRKSSLDKAIFFSRIPVLGSFYKEYSSAFFALEWGKLFSQGLEIKAVIQLMKATNHRSLMGELAQIIEERSMLGQSFYEQLPLFSFFSPELSLIIQQGEVKGKLGKELILYSELCWQRFFNRMEKAIQWIQPIIFLVVALLVVSIYAAMLLPIYGGMEEFL